MCLLMGSLAPDAWPPCSIGPHFGAMRRVYCWDPYNIHGVYHLTCVVFLGKWRPPPLLAPPISPSRQTAHNFLLKEEFWLVATEGRRCVE